MMNDANGALFPTETTIEPTPKKGAKPKAAKEKASSKNVADTSAGIPAAKTKAAKDAPGNEDAEPMKILWSDIFVPPDQYRQGELPDVPALAESLKANGQEQPVSVMVAPSNATFKEPYFLDIGYRRMAAYELNGWKNRTILAVVRPYKGATDPAGRHIRNFIANEEIAETHPLDRADLAENLAAGTYGVLDGETAVPLDVDTIAARLNIPKDSVRKYRALAKNLDADVKVEARKHPVPIRVLNAIAGIKGMGETPEAKASDRFKTQSKALDKYLAEQAALLASGRKKKAPTKAGGKGGGDDEGDEEETAPKPPLATSKAVDKNGFTAEDYLSVLNAKAADTKDKVEGARLKGQIEAFRFLTKEIQNLPGMRAADLAALRTEEETEEEEDGEE